MGGPVPHAHSRSREHLGEGGWLEGRAGAGAVDEDEDEPPSCGGRSRQELRRRVCHEPHQRPHSELRRRLLLT